MPRRKSRRELPNEEDSERDGAAETFSMAITKPSGFSVIFRASWYADFRFLQIANGKKQPPSCSRRRNSMLMRNAQKDLAQGLEAAGVFPFRRLERRLLVIVADGEVCAVRDE